MKNFPLLIIYAFCYCTMFVLTWIAKRKKSNRLFDEKGNLAVSSDSLLGLHFGGIVLLGLIPVTLCNESFESMLVGKTLPSNYYMLVLLFLLIVIGIAGTRAGSQVHICRYNINGFPGTVFIHYFLMRTLFLCAYELFFRGYLLFECIQRAGVFSALLITTGLTVLIHVFTNKKEMWGCIPFGIILGIYCIAFNAVWPAILLHIALSMAYEIPPVYYFVNQLKLVK